MLSRTQLSVLHLMMQLARRDCPADLSVIADELLMSCAEIDTLLVELERMGLVDSDRVRLTMAGLTIALSAPRMARSSRPPSIRPEAA